MRVNRRYRYTQKAGMDRNAWMVTFSDLMTLLMTFFVLLLSMSSLDDQKLKGMFGSLLGVMGVLEYGTKTEVGREPIIIKSELAGGRFLYEARLIQEMVLGRDKKDDEADPFKEGAEVFEDKRGLAIRLPAAVLFKPGSADLSPLVLPYLDRLSAFLAKSEHLIRVEGHTDDRPTSSTSYPSRWELSMARATTVLRYLIDTGHLSPRGFAAVAYADIRPIASNDTEEGRARNRRVEVVLLRNKNSGNSEGKNG